MDLLAPLSGIAAVVVPVFLIAALGFGWSRAKLPYDSAFITTFAINVSTPCLVFSSLARLTLGGDDLLIMAAASIGSMALAGLLATPILLASRLPLRVYLPALSFPNGGKVVNLRIATSERWRDKNTGENKERTEWHSVAIFNENLGRVAEQYLRKGSKVYLEGQLETHKWQDASGQDRYTTEVVLRPYRGELALLDSRGEGGGGYEQDRGGYGGESRGQAGQLDDEIPF